MHERFCGPRANVAAALREASTTAAAACFVDYQLAPKRFQPGFESQLSKKSLLFVYAAFAAGLAATRVGKKR